MHVITALYKWLHMYEPNHQVNRVLPTSLHSYLPSVLFEIVRGFSKKIGLSFSLVRSLFSSLSLSFSRPLSLFPFVCLLSVSVTLSLFVFLSRLISLSVCVSRSLSLFLCVSWSSSLSFAVCLLATLSLSMCFSVVFSLFWCVCLSVTLSLHLCVFLGHNITHTLSLSLRHSVTPIDCFSSLWCKFYLKLIGGYFSPFFCIIELPWKLSWSQSSILAI